MERWAPGFSLVQPCYCGHLEPAVDNLFLCNCCFSGPIRQTGKLRVWRSGWVQCSAGQGTNRRCWALLSRQLSPAEQTLHRCFFSLSSPLSKVPAGLLGDSGDMPPPHLRAAVHSACQCSGRAQGSRGNGAGSCPLDNLAKGPYSSRKSLQQCQSHVALSVAGEADLRAGLGVPSRQGGSVLITRPQLSALRLSVVALTQGPRPSLQPSHLLLQSWGWGRRAGRQQGDPSGTEVSISLSTLPLHGALPRWQPPASVRKSQFGWGKERPGHS